MIMLIPLLLALAGQQPGAAQQPSPRRPVGAGFGEQDAPPRTASDSAFLVVSDVARAVADVRAETDHFRTLAFNAAIGTVLQSASAFSTACRSMADEATRGHGRLCVSCLQRELRTAFGNYRAYLPSLTRLGARCQARLQARATPNATPAALRSTALEMSNMIVTGLRQYEQHVGAIRAAIIAPSRGRGR